MLQLSGVQFLRNYYGSDNTKFYQFIPPVTWYYSIQNFPFFDTKKIEIPIQTIRSDLNLVFQAFANIVQIDRPIDSIFFDRGKNIHDLYYHMNRIKFKYNDSDYLKFRSALLYLIEVNYQSDKTLYLVLENYLATGELKYLETSEFSEMRKKANSDEIYERIIKNADSINKKNIIEVSSSFNPKVLTDSDKKSVLSTIFQLSNRSSEINSRYRDIYYKF